jgi:hypothetical protein
MLDRRSGQFVLLRQFKGHLVHLGVLGWPRMHNLGVLRILGPRTFLVFGVLDDLDVLTHI